MAVRLSARARLMLIAAVVPYFIFKWKKWL